MLTRRTQTAAFTLIALAALATMGSLIGCAPAPQQPEPAITAPSAAPATAQAVASAAAPTTPTADRVRDYPGLQNVAAFAPGVFNGSMPEGTQGLDSLAALGVRTIISVDGARPEVDAASARGMRYIHLPMTYSGVGEERSLQIARAIRDLPRPIYIHCHHGKHRSPAATAAALICLGDMTPEQGHAMLKLSGTSPSYPGLYRSVETERPRSATEINSADATFPAVAQVSSFVGGMVDIDHAYDHLKIIAANNWITPASHPDLVAAAEAGRMVETLRSIASRTDSHPRHADMLAMLHENIDAASKLEDLIVRKAPPADLTAAMSLISASCKDCHKVYRDRSAW